MSNVIDCIQQKISNSNSKLLPTILQAILIIYKSGKSTMTANDVKEACTNINSAEPWKARIPAICNGMRRTLDCGASIIGDQLDSNRFTISFFDGVATIESIDNISSKNKHQNEFSKEINSIKIIKLESKGSNILKSLNLENLKDTSQNKLLIIGCSDSKTIGGANSKSNDYFNNSQYQNITRDRNIKLTQYNRLFQQNQEYFVKKRNGIGEVNVNYFESQVYTPSYLPAIERYGGGRFYIEALRSMYYQKNQDANLHILIISGLYGLLHFKDSIIDYHLEITQNNFWINNNNTIHSSVKKYIIENNISDEYVFYSLSNSYRSALKPITLWNDLWINGSLSANLTNSANFLLTQFLPKL